MVARRSGDGRRRASGGRSAIVQDLEDAERQTLTTMPEDGQCAARSIGREDSNPASVTKSAGGHGAEENAVATKRARGGRSRRIALSVMTAGENEDVRRQNPQVRGKKDRAHLVLELATAPCLPKPSASEARIESRNRPRRQHRLLPTRVSSKTFVTVPGAPRANKRQITAKEKQDGRHRTSMEVKATTAKMRSAFSSAMRTPAGKWAEIGPSCRPPSIRTGLLSARERCGPIVPGRARRSCHRYPRSILLDARRGSRCARRCASESKAARRTRTSRRWRRSGRPAPRLSLTRKLADEPAEDVSATTPRPTETMRSIRPHKRGARHSVRSQTRARNALTSRCRCSARRPITTPQRIC